MDFDTEQAEYRQRAKAAAAFAEELRTLWETYPMHRSDDWRGLRDRLLVQQAIQVKGNHLEEYARIYGANVEERPPFKPVLLT